jgi:inhibitor of KinA sporulation pathway (predicted exonuclease)
VDLFETYEYDVLDGISYWFDIQTWNIRANFSFGNLRVPSLQGLAKALLLVGQERKWPVVQGLDLSRSTSRFGRSMNRDCNGSDNLRDWRITESAEWVVCHLVEWARDQRMRVRRMKR